MVVTVALESKALESALKKASQELDDMRVAFTEIDRDFRKSNIEFFTLKGGGQYAPLNREYNERKTRMAGRALPILVGAGKDGGRLRDSMVRQNGRDVFREIEKKSMITGTETPYSGFVQDGTSKMPARPYILVKPDREKRWSSILAAEVGRKMKQVGL